MTEKEKAEVIAGLAKSAYDQFERLAEVSWKLRLSVWIAFGASSGFILSTENWRPSIVDCIVGALITVGIISVMVFVWGPYTYRRSIRFLRVSQYWESVLEDLVGIRLPSALHAATLGTGGHLRHGEDTKDKAVDPWYKSPVYLSQALITTLFGLLLIGAFVSRVRTL